MECSRPVYAYFEEDSKGDETMLLSWKQIRQFVYPEPSYEVKEEEVRSCLNNTGETPMKGIIRMRVQRLSDNSWSDVEEIYKDSSPREISFVYLDELWNNNAFYTDERENATYRAVIEVINPYGEVLVNGNGNYMNASINFTLKIAKINVTINISAQPSANSFIKITKGNETLASGYESVAKAVDQFEIYNITTRTPLENFDDVHAKIININMSESENVTIQVVENYTHAKPSSISKLTPVFAMKELSNTYEKVEISLPKGGIITSHILHCTDWDFSAANCSAWEVNKTSDYNAAENETHIIFNVTQFDAYAAGQQIALEVYLNAPPNNTIVPHERNFTINATVICRLGDCGVVNATARYNASGSNPDTAISTTPGATPFWSYDANPQSCVLDQDENCTVIWRVNASGELKSKWYIDVLFTSQYANANNTNDSLVEIGKILILIIENNTLSFGEQEPSMSNLGPNSTHISLDPNSNDADGIYIKGTDLICKQFSNYKIGVGNISWCRDYPTACTGPDLNFLSHEWQLFAGYTQSGTSYLLSLWLDTPPVYYGDYEGSVMIMANTSY